MNLSKDTLTEHLLKHKQVYLFSLLVLVLLLPIFVRTLNSQPLIFGPESYYHLSQAQHLSWNNFYYFPLTLLLYLNSEMALLAVPFVLALLSLLLCFSLLKKLEIEKTEAFVLLFFLVLSPVFTFAYSTLSVYSWYFFLLVLGFWLLLQERPLVQYLAILPFSLTTLVDLCSSLFTILSIFIYYWHTRQQSKEHRQRILTILTTMIVVTLGTILLFGIPLFLGPFYPADHFSDLISDLGSRCGTPFFILLLGLFGLAYAWKEKKNVPFYLFLPLVVIVYIFNRHYGFLLSMVAIYFAAKGLLNLFSGVWSLKTLKHFTLLIILLGLLFSIITYNSRINLIGPTENDKEVLTWVKENIPNDPQYQTVFSLPENSYYVRYFAQRQPFYDYHRYREEQNKVNITGTLLTSSYISTIFPLLENNGLGIIYITAAQRNEYSEEQGLLFVLKNERFKIVHSHEEDQVWVFN